MRCLSVFDLCNLGFEDNDDGDDDDSALSLLEDLSIGTDHCREKLLLPPPENPHKEAYNELQDRDSNKRNQL